MNRTTTVVFVGPTLAAAEARALLPGADVRGPVAVGDVLRLRRVARIAIVDGYFERMAAVWHKEILFALAARTAVYGASSMGALRAAELAPFGMVGVGAIARDFRRGTLVDDDEVAVAHLPADSGYAAVSTAMVDLRAGLARARRAGAITAADEARLIALGKARFYRERTWEQLVDDARAARLPRRALAGLTAHGPVAQKAADARALLRLLARTPERRPPRPRWTFSRTWFWNAFTQLA